MNCPECGKEVKPIAVSGDTCVLCETEEIEVVTMSGRVFRGYMRHECDGKKKERNSCA